MAKYLFNFRISKSKMQRFMGIAKNEGKSTSELLEEKIDEVINYDELH